MNSADIKKVYEGLFDEVSAAILVVLPPDGKIISVNLEAEELTGYEKSELENMTFADIFRPEDRSRIVSIFQAPVNFPFQKLFEHNVIIQKRSKRKIVVDMGFRAASLGTKDALVFTLQDITDLRANQVRVQRANDYINNIIQSVRETLIVLDEEGKIKTINDAALSLLGYKRKELVGEPFGKLIAQTPESRLHLRNMLENHRIKEVEVMLADKDENPIPVLLSASEMKGGKSPKKDGIVIVAMDISERKKAERLISEQQMIIFQAAKMSSLGEMASGIAHEINNPLHVIMGCCEMLNLFLTEKNIVDNDIRDQLNTIGNMSHRIEKIVHGLKALARDQGNDPFELVKLSAIVNDTLALCEQRIRKRGINLKVSEVPEHLQLLCHPTMISQVLLNLLNNSYDAIENKPDPWIRVDLVAKDDSVTISVTDSGKGIPKEVLESIFKPFFTTKPVGKGTGLGLSISKSIIESHKGTLSYDQQSSHSKFDITLKLALDQREDEDGDDLKSA